MKASFVEMHIGLLWLFLCGLTLAVCRRFERLEDRIRRTESGEGRSGQEVGR